MMAVQVEIFKTNVLQECDANDMIRLLLQHCPNCRINFDLDDCDRILRIESRHHIITIQQIIHLMTVWGYTCTHLT
ncbi:MAG: hypothetical protein JWR50_919 [Mucilaginibacter sp.]|nr:hypothetical protein [Mucilaginibacter sp.]